MAFDGNGTYSLPVNSLVPDAVSGTTIVSDDFDEFTSDIETALSNTICRDGQSTITADLPMGGNRHTGVDDAAALTDYASANQVVANTLTYGGASSAGSDTYAVNLPISPGAYAAGNRFQFIADVSNTGACSLNVNSLGAKSIVLSDGNDPFSGAILADSVADVMYDGTAFILLNPFDSALSGVTASAAELNVLDGVTGGTVTASKGVVVDGSKDIGTFGTVTAATFSGNLSGDVTGDITGNVTATSVLADGVTATTQTQGDDSTKVATTAYVDASARVTVFKSSARTTYAAGDDWSEAHGLGAAPDEVSMIWKCISTDGGWAAGDRVASMTSITTTNIQGESCAFSAANVFGVIGSAGARLAHKTTGDHFTPASGKWEIYLIAKLYV